MKKKRILIILALCLALMLLTACEMPTKNPTSSPADVVFQTAQAAAAGTLTQQANLVPSQTTAPIFTTTSTVAPSEITLVPPTPSKPMVSVSKETNCRVGPDTSFTRLSGLLPGVMAEVVGLDTSGQYYYIRNHQDSQNFCWLWGYYATLAGDGSNLPRFTPMPTPTITITPTPVPNFSILSQEIDGCVGSFVEVSVKNTGSTVWSSGSVISKDTVTNFTTSETKSDDFYEVNGCVYASAIQGDLAPGEIGFLQGSDFIAPVAGHPILVTVKLCTQNLLAGTCMTKEITFTP
jgi:hypothetical protein